MLTRGGLPWSGDLRTNNERGLMNSDHDVQVGKGCPPGDEWRRCSGEGQSDRCRSWMREGRALDGFRESLSLPLSRNGIGTGVDPPLPPHCAFE